MKLRKKALFPAIAMVLASVIALSGVTYAWFTTSNEATIGTLDVNVATANGIQVSLDAVSWRSTLTGQDIIDAAKNGLDNYGDAVNQFPTGEIAPVSSAGDVVGGKLQMFYGAYNEQGTLDSVKEEEVGGTSGNFIAFDLFIKSSMDQSMSMILGQTASYVASTDAFGGSTNAKTESAVRVAFIPMGSAATDAAAQALTGDTAYIWEPNATDRAAGVTYAGAPDTMGFYTEFSNIAEADLGADQVKKVTTMKEGSEFKDFFALKNGINKIRIYIWLEGQDIDCVNAISSGDFSVNLYFTVPKIEN